MVARVLEVCPTYIFWHFLAYDGIYSVSASAGESVFELEGLSGDGRVDGMVGEYFGAGKALSMVTESNSVLFRTYLYGDVGGGSRVGFLQVSLLRPGGSKGPSLSCS